MSNCFKSARPNWLIIPGNVILNQMPEKGKKVILHIDLDCFFVSVERVLNPGLKGKAVIVSGNPEGRGVVSSASYEARAFGVKSGMPIQKARRLCKTAIVLPVRMSAYAEFSEKVFELLRDFSPLVEEASIDEAYLDLTGTERLFGPAPATALLIQKRIQEELGLPGSLGIGGNKMIAKIASQLAKPGGIVEVPAGSEESFLSELEIGAIPGVGGKTEERLILLGAKKIKHLIRLGPELLAGHFGKMGRELYERARGLADDQVVAEEEMPKSIGKEVTFEQDLYDLGQIEQWLYLLALKLGLRLRRKELYAKRITLKFRSPEFITWTRTTGLDFAANQDSELLSSARELLLREKEKAQPLRLLGISAGDLSLTRQPGLFGEEERQKRERLTKALDQARQRFGFDAIYPAQLKQLMEKIKEEEKEEEGK